jgi:trimeric autotransporter adhesin
MKVKNSISLVSFSQYIRKYLFFMSFFFLMTSVSASGESALPSNPDVQLGNPSITTNGDTMTINAGEVNKTWIDWNDGFNIGANNTVNNIADSIAATILHNDVSGNISNIQGVLNGNCNVFLLNSNGILFSPSAQVNVGSLVASSLMMSEDAFENGTVEYVLQAQAANAGLVLNQGTLEAIANGSIILAGGAVQNAGTIQVNLGTVNLVSGEEVTLNISGDGSIQAAVTGEVLNNVYDQDGNQVNVGVQNVGDITADGGTIYMQTGAVEDIFETLVSQEGIVRAGSMVERDGKIVLISNSEGIVQNTGTLDASVIEAGVSGGEIEMRGSMVGQFGIANADAIDGDGGDIDIYAEDVVSLSSDSLTTANAGLNGNGGEIIVFSPDTALFRQNANIEAKGGSVSGDGGFVEVSGKEHVEVFGSVNAGAVNGSVGMFFIDPTDVTLSDATSNMINSPAWEPSGAVATGTIDIATIVTSLQAGTSVSVVTTSGGAGTGRIIVDNAISVDLTTVGGASTETPTLTLTALDDIDINAQIIVSATDSAGDLLNVTLSSVNHIDVGGNITTNNGNVSIVTSAADKRITHSAGAINAGTGSVTLRADDMTLTGTSITGNGGINIYTTTASTIIQLDAITEVGGQLELPVAMLETLASTGTVTIGQDGFNTGVIEVNGGAAINLLGESFNLTLATDGAINNVDGGSNALTINALKTLTLNAGTSIGASNAVYTAATVINADAGSSNLTLTNTGAVTDLQLNADSGTITFINTGTINTGAAITANVIDLTSSGAMTIDQNVTADAGAIALTSASGINLDGNIDATANIDVNNALTLTDASIITSSTGNVTFDSTIVGTSADNLTVSATSGIITFSGAVGGNSQISAINLDAATLTQNAAITGTGEVDIDVTNSLTIDENITSGGATNINVNTDNNTFTLTSGDTISSTSGTLTIMADDMDLSGVITATSQIVALKSYTAADTIDIGTNGAVAGELELSDTELDTITATTLRIGSTTAGAIAVTAAITPANITNLTLLSDEGVGDESNAGTITLAGGLRIDVDTAVDLSASNDVNTLAVNISGTGALTFADSDELTIGTVDGMSGVVANSASNVTVTTVGIMTVSDVVTSVGGNISFSVTTSDTNFNHTAAAISAGAGSVTIRSDDMSLAGTSITGNGGINIYTKDTDTAIALGSNTSTANQLDLTTVELQLFASSGTVTIGENGTNTGAITIGASAIDLSSETFNLTLATEGAIDDTTGSSNALSIANAKTLTIDAGTTIGATNALNTVATIINADAGTGSLSIINTGNVTDLQLNADSGTITFNNTGTINTGAAISANVINLTSSSTMTIDQNITADVGAVVLNSSAGVDIDADISATTSVTIESAGSVDVAAGDQITAGGNSTAITINGTDVTLNAGSVGSETVKNTGSGTISLEATSDNMFLDENSVSAADGSIVISAENGEIVAVNITGTQEIDSDGNVTLTAVGIGSDTNNLEITGDAGADKTLTIISTSLNGDDIDITEMTAQFNTINLTIADADVDVDISLVGANDEIDINGSADTLTLNSLDGQDSNRSFSVTLTEDTKTMALTEIYTDSGTVTLVSSGAITDAGTTEITATTASITADGGIGSGNALETAVTNLSVTNNDVDGSSSNILITNTGALTLNGAVNNDGGNVTIIASSPLTVAADVTATGDGDITLTATEDGGNDDTITINANISILAEQGDITLTAGQNITFTTGGILIRTGGDGTIDLNADNADGALNDGDIFMNATDIIQTTGTGAITLDADDALTVTNIISGGAITIDSDGGGTISFNGDIENTNGTITFSDAVTLITGASTVTSAAGGVTFSGTVNGAQNLTVNADNGTATFSSAVGGTTSLMVLTVNAGTISAGAITTTGANETAGGNIALTSLIGDVTATTINANGGTDSGSDGGHAAGTVTIVSADDISITSINATGSAAAGGDGAGGAAGAISISAPGETTTIVGNLTATGGNGNGSGNGGAGANINLNSKLVISGDRTLNSSSGTGGTPNADGNIYISGTINATNAANDTLIITTDAGTVTLEDSVGDVLPLESLNIDSTGVTTINNSIITDGADAGDDLELDGATNVVLGSNVYLYSENQDVTLNAINGSFDLTVYAGTVVQIGGHIGTVNALQDISLTSDTDIIFNANVIGTGTLTVTSGGGSGEDISIGGNGNAIASSVIFNAGSSGITTVSNTQNNTSGSTTYNGLVTIDGALITLTSATNMTFNGAVTVSTIADGGITSTNGSIDFNTDLSGAETINLNAAEGNIALQTVGAGDDPTLLDLDSLTAEFSGDIGVVALDATGVGLTTLAADITITASGAAGILLGDLDGAKALTLTASNGSGVITFADADIQALTIDDGFTTSFAGDFVTSGNVAVSGVTGEIDVASACSIQSGGTISLANNHGNGIDINGLVTGDGGVSMTATASNVAIDADVTTAGGGVITLAATAGTVTISQAVVSTVTAVNGKIDIDAGTSVLLGHASRAGQFVTTGTGDIDVDAATAVTMAGAGSIINSGGAVNIGTNTESVTVTTAGSGITAVGNIIANADNTITVNGVIQSTSGSVALTVAEGGDAVGTIAVAANIIGDDVTITASDAQAGTAVINVTSVLNNNRGGYTFEASDGTLNIDSNITGQDFVALNGSTAITLAANLTATDNDITVNDALTLDGDSTVTSTSGDITFSSTIDSTGTTRALTLNADAEGTITLGDALGTGFALKSLTVSAGTLNIASNISTDAGAVSGTVDFSEVNAVVLTGNVIIDTENGDNSIGGDVTFKADGTINGAYSLSIDAGVTTASNGGNVQLGIIGNTTAINGITVDTASGSTTDGTLTLYGNITSNGSVTLTDADIITLAGNVAITTSNDLVNLGAADTVNGAYTLDINAGTGAVTLATMGNSTNLTGLTVVGGVVAAADNVSVDGAYTIDASTSINSDGTVDVDGLNGNVNFASDGAIDLDGSITVDGASTIILTADAEANGTGDLNIALTTDGIAITGVDGDITLVGDNIVLGDTDSGASVTTGVGGGDIKVTASEDFTMGSDTSNVITSGGTITIDPDDVTIDGAGMTASGDIDVVADESIIVNAAVTSTAGDVRLTACMDDDVDADDDLTLAANVSGNNVYFKVESDGSDDSEDILLNVNLNNANVGGSYTFTTDVTGQCVLIGADRTITTDNGFVTIEARVLDTADADFAITTGTGDISLQEISLTTANTGTGLVLSSTGITTLNGAITTQSGPVDLSAADNVVLGTDIAIDTTDAGADAAGDHVDFTAGTGTDSLSGAFDLSITAGTAGDVEFDNASGVVDVTVVSADDVTFSGNFNIDGTLNITSDQSVLVSDIVTVGGSIDFSVTDATNDANAGLINIDAAVISAGNIVFDADGTVEDATVDIDAAITAGGTLTITADVSVAGDTGSVDIAGGTAQADGDISIKADDTIAINTMVDSTGGTTTIGDNDTEGTLTVGAVIRGTTVTLDADDSTGIVTISTDPNNTRGNITVNAVNTFNLNTNMSALNNIIVTPATTLGATSIVTSTSGDVTFTGAIDGANNLTVSAANGTATFSSTVGTTTKLTAFTVSAATANLGGNISTDGGTNADVTFTGTEAVVLTANVIIDTETGGNAVGGDVAFKTTGTITGDYDFDIITTGLVTDGTVQLSSVDTNSLDIDSTNTVTLYGNIIADDDVSLDGATNVDLAADVLILGDGDTDVLLNGSDVAGDFDLEIDAGLGAVTLGLTVSQTEIDVNKLTVTTTGQTTINGNILTDEGMDFGDATNVDIGTNVVLTNADSGTVDLTGGAFDGAFTLTITANATDVSLDNIGQNAATGVLTVTSTGITTLTGDITTANANIDLDSATNIILGADLTISSGAVAGNIDFVTTAGDNSLSGEFDLTLIAGTGTIYFDNVSELMGLTVTSSGTTQFMGVTNIVGPIAVTATTLVDVDNAVSTVGAITFTSTAVIDIDAPVNSTGAGDITMTAGTNILLADEVRTTTTGDVTLTATAGEIDDDDAGTEDEFVAGDVVTMTAKNGIGETTSDIDTEANSLNVSSTTEGDIVIDEYDAVTLTDMDTVIGTITVSADGRIIATDVDATGTGDDVILTTTLGGMVLTSVIADDDITVTAYQGDITIALVGDGGTDDIIITATTGAIDEVTPEDGGSDVVGDALTLTAQDGVGQAHALETTVVSITSSVDSVGNLNIAETDGIILTDVSTTDGSITVSAGGEIEATSVNASGYGSDVTLTTTAGGIILTEVLADDDITATADAGDITVDVAGDAGTDDITVTATLGSINGIDDDDDAAEFTADVLSLTARDEIGGTIGGATAIETEVTTISADSTLAGDINFKELDSDGDGINLLSIDTNEGNITIQTNGGTHESGTETTITSVKSDTGVSGANDISLTAITGDITLSGNTTDTTNLQSDDDITLTATAGSVTEDSTISIQGDSYVDIQGDKLTVTATDEIGSLTGEFDIETTIATLDASSETSGDIIITETNGITLEDVDTAAGTITVTAAGLVTATDVNATGTGADVNLSTTTGGMVLTLVLADDDITTTADAGNITIGQVGDTATDDVTITATLGSIQESVVDDLVDIYGDALVLTSYSGIGLYTDEDNLSSINTQVTELTASVTNSGQIVIYETNDITLNDVDTANGNVYIESVSGSITVDSSATISATGEEVYLLTNTGDITNPGTITAGTDVTLYALVGNVVQSGTITADDDAYLYVDTGNITNSGTVTGADDIELYTSDGNVIQNGDVTAVDVLLRTNDGNITDTTDETTDVSATNLTVTAELGTVGASGLNNELDTDTVNLTLTSQGDAYILEQDAITLTSVISTAGLIDIESGGTMTLNVITADGAVNLYANGGNILDNTIGTTLITAGADSSLKATGLIGSTIDPYDPVNVNITGNLSVFAGSIENQVSAIFEGRVLSSYHTEKLTIERPSTPGLVLLNNHLMGGGNYGSRSSNGSILDRGYGAVSRAMITASVETVFNRAMQSWGYRLNNTGSSTQILIEDSILNGPAGAIDGSEIGLSSIPAEISIQPEEFQVNKYYVIKTINNAEVF